MQKLNRTLLSLVNPFRISPMVREHKNNRSDGMLFIHIITLELGACFTISDITQVSSK